MAPGSSKAKKNTNTGASSKELPTRPNPQTNKATQPAQKTWTQLTASEKIDWANQLFISTGAWKNWPEGLQREFLKSVEGKEGYSWKRGENLVVKSSEVKGGSEFEELRKESWVFKERRFICRGKSEKGITKEEIEEEKARRRKMAMLEGRRQSEIGRYSVDPEWDDVVPMVQQEDPGALASIAYTEEYAEAISYLRAIMATSEYSTRVIDLTSHIISLNASHYTVWLYRSKTLFALSSPLLPELAWLNTIALQNQKNYQIWHHRQLLLTHLYPDPKSTEHNEDTKKELITRERKFMSQMFAQDSKNYHVWSFRQWFIRYFNLFGDTEELTFTNDLITQDILNNSAYSHRFFIIFSNPNITTSTKPTEPDQQIPKHIIEREIEWTKSLIFKSPQNASSWAYLRGVLQKGAVPLSELEGFAEHFVYLGLDEEGNPLLPVEESGGDGDGDGDGAFSVVMDGQRVGGKEVVKSSWALEFLADVWGEEEVVGRKKKADLAFRLLGERYDVVRRRYWEWRREGL